MDDKQLNTVDDKPLVMVWVGPDEMNRGDTQGMIGLARNCARLVNGRFICLDDDVVTQMFSKTTLYKDRIKAALKKYGAPDMLFGRYSTEVYDQMRVKPRLFVHDINETISLSRDFNRYVAHDITPNKLKDKAVEFYSHYPDIKGPLFGVFIGGSNCQLNNDGRDLAKKIYYLAARHDEATIFLCPSRRSKQDYARLYEHLQTGFSSWFDDGSLSVNFRKAIGRAPNVHIMGEDYLDMLGGYNPYVGLMGAADHLFVIGDSFSIACETMAVGKPVYMDFMYRYYDDLVDSGHIIPIHKIGSTKLTKYTVPPVNMTTEIAKVLVDEYKASCARQTKEPKSP